MNAVGRFTPILLAGALILGACGGGGGGTTVSLTFEAPQGSGLADGQVGRVPVAPSVRRDFTFAAGIAVAGRVTDANGTPVADARVSYRLSAKAPDVASDRTDAGGNYSVTISEGTWIVLVDGGDARGTLTATGVAIAGAGPLVRDFAYLAPWPVGGRVFDSLGAGIDAARVRFTGVRTGARATVFCDASGAYAAVLPPDTYEAVVTPAGPAEDTHLKQRFPGIAVGAALVRDFTLVRGVAVSGTVLDDLGLPLLEETEIDVELSTSSVFFAPGGDVTDAGTGRYAIGPLPPESVTFVVRPPSDSGFPVQRFTRRIGATQDFMLRRGVVLSGTIYRDDGLTPEGNVEVELVPSSGTVAPDGDRTDGSGRYEISLFPGIYGMRITPRPDDLQLEESRAVTIGGPTVLDVTLRRGALLEGTVRDPSGAPTEKIRVEIAGIAWAADTTDGSGRYSLLAPPGTHTLLLSAEEGPFEDVALAPVPGVVVTLPGPNPFDVGFSLATEGSCVIRGTAYAPGGVVGVAGAVVEARTASGGVAGRTVTDAAGAYVLVIP